MNQPTDNKTDEASIRQAYASITTAYRERNARGAMAPYVKDDSLVLFDIPPPLSVVGYAGSLKSTQDIIDAADGPVSVKYTNLHITVDNLHAYAHFFVGVTGSLKNGQKIDFMGRGTSVWEKKNGEWLIVHEHGSVPVDLATGKADLHSAPTGAFAGPFTK